MKKILAFILAVFHVAGSSGATIDFHYCMGQFTGWDLSMTANQTCNTCGMKKEDQKGCCHDKQTTLQLQKDQLIATTNTIPGNTATEFHCSTILEINSFPSSHLPQYFSHGSPPGFKSLSSYLLNCVFRI